MPGLKQDNTETASRLAWAMAGAVCGGVVVGSLSIGIAALCVWFAAWAVRGATGAIFGGG